VQVSDQHVIIEVAFWSEHARNMPRYRLVVL
jgi:hypothetical protein